MTLVVRMVKLTAVFLEARQSGLSLKALDLAYICCCEALA